MTDSEKDLAGGSRSCATERGGSRCCATEGGGARSCATEGGGSRCCATEGGVVVADARERVPPGLAHGTLGSPAGGSRSCATEGGVVVADARERVPPGLPVRSHPSRNSVMTFHDNRAILLYVTIVTADRMPVLACAAVVECILAAWAAATDWLVGRYVIMPDHIHFFCAPASYPPPDFRRWMAYWKSLSAKAYWRIMGGSRSCATEGEVRRRTRRSASLPCLRTPRWALPREGRAPARPEGALWLRTRRSASLPGILRCGNAIAGTGNCAPARVTRRNGNMCVTILCERD